MRIDIFQDLICPWCYIGRHRFRRAVAERPALPLELHWQPFQLNPTMAPQGMDRRAYLEAKFGGADRASEVYRLIAETADRDGLPLALDRIRRTPNTLNAHRLVRFLTAGGADPGTAVDALYAAFFVAGEDIGDLDVLSDVAAGFGVPPAETLHYLAGKADSAAVLAADLAARQRGIQAVPCFVIEGRYAVSGAQEPHVFLPLLDLAAV